MNRPKNYASKEMEGKYSIEIKENEVKIHSSVWNRDFKSVTIRCHPDDTFDIGEAIKIGMNRLNVDDIIRVGDTVKIIDNRCSCSTLSNWDDVDKEYSIHYRYGVCPSNGTIGKVVGIRYDNIIIQVKLENYLGDKRFNDLTCFDCVYVVSKCGLEKIKDGRYE